MSAADGETCWPSGLNGKCTTSLTVCGWQAGEKSV
eukprot:CAMPEP_0168360224 /NCGR_PEP_ID=MMETSP0228-20121227/2051_1 /TAXON_ID=133427 /ORGANISM="Protoceratium reticulatum, Strain CCCM 535 (=CCMP 1889)" /LENGTH=34 /DNA_ID= /DNA_START= /DNA_END= /DNA_ORIENTATION=